MSAYLVTPPHTGLPRRWNTLQLLKGSRTALLSLDVLLLLAALWGTHVQRDAMKTVGQDTAPSIIAAQRIKSAVADMDADAANELLSAPGQGSNTQAYDARRIEAAEALINAARNITYPAEVPPIQSLQVGLGTYERMVQKARDLHDEGNVTAVLYYREAESVMDGKLMPSADNLDRVNNEVLERTYKAESTGGLLARLSVMITGLLVLTALGALQLFLARRTRRSLNPLLLLATLIVLFLAAHTLDAMGTSQKDLKIAKEDAFESVHALRQARAIAYEANGEESRYLLDPNRAAQSQAAFDRESHALAASSAETSQELFDSIHGGKKMVDFTGYLGDELNNITFPGEREAAISTLANWETYLAVDKTLRQLERSGQHKQAVDLCVGNAAGQSDWAFTKFDEALGATLDINEKAFNRSVDSGVAALNWLDWEAATAAALIALLVFLGLAPRIREYL